MTAFRRPSRFWLMILGFWAATATILIARSLHQGPGGTLFGDTDDAMRLVVVRDFLAGQNWFDHVQHRLNTPFGADIHWSRLIDLPIAVLITLFGILSPGNGETLALYVWPLGLMLVMFILSARLSIQLCGPDALLPALALPAFALPVLSEFGPGRIDHHNMQIILTLWLVLATAAAWTDRRQAVWAGVAAATALAIGAESLPFAAAAIVAFGLMWVADAGRARQMRQFGMAFGLATLVHLVIYLPPSAYFAVQCDALSVVYVAAALGTGALFAVLPSLPLTIGHWGVRLAAGVVAGAVLALGLALVFPKCLAGPFADLDPWLQAAWLNRVVESRSLWVSLMHLPGYTLGIALPPILAILALVIQLWRGGGEKRAEWLFFGLFLVLAVATFVWQIRGARLAAALSVPAGAWAILAVRAVYLGAPKRLKTLGAAALVLTWVGFSGIAVVAATNLALPETGAKSAPGLADCSAPSAFSALAGLAPARIVAPIDLGPHILAFTHHGVVGAPYQRNGQGIGDTFRIFGGPQDTAQMLMKARGISLVVTCDALLGSLVGTQPEPGSLADLMLAGKLPDWLTEISPPGSLLHIYAVGG